MSGYKRVNYYELCRLCTSTEGTKMHIFREEGRRRQLSVKIQLCLPLQIQEEDSLPKIICTDCVDKLESYYEFREACVNAEAMLESYFSTIRAEDHKEGMMATVYVREMSSPSSKSQDVKRSKVESAAPAPATLVLPMGSDGLSNIMQAAGIQIITEGDPSRLQPLLNAAPAVMEAGDGSRYTFLSNNPPTPDLISKQQDTKAEVSKQSNSDSSDEGSQHSQPQHRPSQTITFASGVPGQEMMVHFNLKDSETTNAQLQRASIAQLGELLRMNLVESANVVRDPSVPGGLRILGLPTTLLAPPQSHEQPQEQQHSTQQCHHTQQQQHQEQIHLHHHHLNPSTAQASNCDSSQSSQTSVSTPPKKQVQKIKEEALVQLPQQAMEHPQQYPSPPIPPPYIEMGEEEGEIIMGTGICEHCCKGFDTEEELIAHRSLCSAIEAVVGGAGGDGDDKGVYPCEECGKAFKRKEHLFQHQKLHTGERPYVCEHCNKSFSRKEHLMRHAVSHSGTKLFECEQCGKNFSRKDNLHKHRKTHTVPGPFICEVCGKSFVVKHYYLMHQACHGTTIEDENGDIIEDPLAFKCDVCGKGFPNNQFLSTHRARHRKKVDPNKGNSNDSEGQISPNKQSLEEHTPPDNSNLHLHQPHMDQPPKEESHQHEIQHLIDGNHIVPVTLQTGVSSPNGIPVNTVISPQILQQIVPTSSQGPAVIQVQTSSAGTTYLCSSELLETYRRMQSS